VSATHLAGHAVVMDWQDVSLKQTMVLFRAFLSFHHHAPSSSVLRLRN
jgi:hypothetical protein